MQWSLGIHAVVSSILSDTSISRCLGQGMHSSFSKYTHTLLTAIIYFWMIPNTYYSVILRTPIPLLCLGKEKKGWIWVCSV